MISVNAMRIPAEISSSDHHLTLVRWDNPDALGKDEVVTGGELRFGVPKLPGVRGMQSLCSIVLLMFPSAPALAQQREISALLSEADRLFMLYDFWKALPRYAKAERLCAQIGDKRNELYAKISQFPADPGTLSFPEISRYLDKVLETPLAVSDPQLRLRCLIVKGVANIYFDVPSSADIWHKVQALAAELNDGTWRSRASAELSIGAFLNTDYSAAVKLISNAIYETQAAGDQAGLVRALSLLARGYGELGRHEEAVAYADQALRRSESATEFPFASAAYAAKIQGLIGLGRLAEARQLMDRSMEQVSQRMHCCPDLAVCAGMLAQAEGKVADAIKLYNAAADLCKRYGIPGYYGNALAKLTRLYLDMGQVQAADDMIMRGIDSNRRVGDIFVLPVRLALAADVKLRLGKKVEARELLEEATDISEAMLVNAPTVTLKSSLISFMNDLYVSRFKLAAANPAIAFQVLEEARASTTAQLVRTGRGEVSSTAIEKRLVEIQKKLLQARTSAERQELLQQLFYAEHSLAPVLFAQYPAATIPATLTTRSTFRMLSAGWPVPQRLSP